MVAEEYVLCGRTFQGVILFLADVVTPERFRQAVDVRGLESEVAVFCKKGDFHIFDDIVIFYAFPVTDVLVIQLQFAVNGSVELSPDFKFFIEDVSCKPVGKRPFGE